MVGVKEKEHTKHVLTVAQLGVKERTYVATAIRVVWVVKKKEVAGEISGVRK